jgi:hypothetical protein
VELFNGFVSTMTQTLEERDFSQVPGLRVENWLV